MDTTVIPASRRVLLVTCDTARHAATEAALVTAPLALTAATHLLGLRAASVRATHDLLLVDIELPELRALHGIETLQSLNAELPVVLLCRADAVVMAVTEAWSAVAPAEQADGTLDAAALQRALNRVLSMAANAPARRRQADYVALAS